MNISRYTVVVGNCGYALSQLVQALSNSDEWMKQNIQLFEFREGYYPKEIVIRTNHYQNFEGLERALQKLK